MLKTNSLKGHFPHTRTLGLRGDTVSLFQRSGRQTSEQIDSFSLTPPYCSLVGLGPHACWSRWGKADETFRHETFPLSNRQIQPGPDSTENAHNQKEGPALKVELQSPADRTTSLSRTKAKTRQRKLKEHDGTADYLVTYL